MLLKTSIKIPRFTRPSRNVVIDTTSPQADGLRSLWGPFQNLNGPVLWSTGEPLYELIGNFHGQLSGSSAGPPSGFFGFDDQMGMTLNFDANVSHLEWVLPTTLPFTSDELTMSCWCKKVNNSTPGSAGTSGAPFGLSFYGGSPISHYPWTDDRWYCSTLRGTTRPDWAIGSFDKSVWHHYAITTKPGASGWNAYQGGEVVQTATGDSSLGTTLYLPGIGGQNNFCFYGDVCDVRLYSRCMSAEEIRSCASLESRWELYRESSMPAYFFFGAAAAPATRLNNILRLGVA